MTDPFEYIAKNLHTKDEQFPDCMRLKGEIGLLSVKHRAMRLHGWVGGICGGILTLYSGGYVWLAVSMGITERLGWKFFFLCAGVALGLMFMAVPVTQRSARKRIADEIHSKGAQYSACNCERFE